MFSVSPKREYLRQVRLGSPSSKSETSVKSRALSAERSECNSKSTAIISESVTLKAGDISGTGKREAKAVTMTVNQRRKSTTSPSSHFTANCSSSGSLSSRNPTMVSAEFSSSRVSPERNQKKKNVFTSSTANLMSLLESKGIEGVVMNRVFESTVYYEPGRDEIHLRFFKSKDIGYILFRMKLLNFFELSFSDTEFEYLANLFDVNSTGKIDGFEFLIFYIKLSTLRKNRDAVKHREILEEATRVRELEDERKKLEFEKKMSSTADYTFTNSNKVTAMEKLAVAAKRYDPTDILCPTSNLDGYTGAVLNAGERGRESERERE